MTCATCKYFARGFTLHGGYCKFHQYLEVDWNNCKHYEGSEK